MRESNAREQDIAVVGLACRFPGASNAAKFWENLRSGRESISFLGKEELYRAGLPREVVDNPAFVNACGILPDYDRFDAGFFGISAREAELMDPQHRVFLETSYEALENAGYDARRYDGVIGVYAGASFGGYQLLQFQERTRVDPIALASAWDKDYLSTRVSYKLGLTGPSIGIQTTCSTSLVAVCVAVQSLWLYQCDMALAGGVTVRVPISGYMPLEGHPFSRDGHTRPFDWKSTGTCFGSGVGIVVLKRLQDALADGDYVHAVIRGVAINNDGSTKIGYTAPSVDGQAQVIAMAHGVAGVDPATISYVEAHGTGTPIGDPIEMEGLIRAFRLKTDKKGFCAVGSVKSNLGHLECAAGIAGLIKTILMLKHRELVPNVNFEKANPNINLAGSPFYVCSRLTDWNSGSGVRRAGVSSFGVGGTNAHVVVEEAPELLHSGKSREWQIFPVSARSPAALGQTARNLAEFLVEERETKLADVAYTQSLGRQALACRDFVVGRDSQSVVAALSAVGSASDSSFADIPEHVVFMFPGGGSQYIGMGAELYRTETVFREAVDRCAEACGRLIDVDLRRALYTAENEDGTVAPMRKSSLVVTTLFATEYALARLLMNWGIRPDVMIGHSLGEYVAACLAGVFSLEDAIRTVAVRGSLLEEAVPGAMLGIALSEEELTQLLPADLSLAAVNGPQDCVVAGSQAAIERFRQLVDERQIVNRALGVSSAGHSFLVDSCSARFRRFVETIELNEPRIPFVSNVTGAWIASNDATSADYWVRHLRRTVRFADGLKTLAEESSLFVEVGPGRSLCALVRRNLPSLKREPIASMRYEHEKESDIAIALKALGRVWRSGVDVDWGAFYAREDRQRLPLPTYPFDRQRFWIGKDEVARKDEVGLIEALKKRLTIDDWFYVPCWRQEHLASLPERVERRWLVFTDEHGLGKKIVEKLRLINVDSIVTVSTGVEFQEVSPDTFVIQSDSPEDYQTLMARLRSLGSEPTVIVHSWSVSTGVDPLQECSDHTAAAFYSLLFLAQASSGMTKLKLVVVSNDVHEVIGGDGASPEKALLLGACKVIPQELEGACCLAVDVQSADLNAAGVEDLAVRVICEANALTPRSETAVAYRGNYRWARGFQPVPVAKIDDRNLFLRQKGTYLITGGLGRIGIELAVYLATKAKARLVLVGRSPFPDPSEWDSLATLNTGEDETAAKIRRLREIRELGGDVIVRSVDVADEVQMRAVVDEVVKTFGAIDGVIHAAGIAGEGVIDLKSKAQAAKVLSAKISGTLVLTRLLKDMPLEFMVLCSSTIALTGGVGQIDYCAANAFMDSFAIYARAHLNLPVVSINWDGWENVGGVARPTLSQNNAGLEGEPTDRTIDHPLLMECVRESVDEAIYQARLSPEKDWILDEHRIGGVAVLPGTAYLEMAIAAFLEREKLVSAQLSDVVISRPLAVENGATKRVRTLLRRADEGYDFQIVSENGPGENWTENASGRISALETPSRTEVLQDLHEIDVGGSDGMHARVSEANIP